MNADQCVHCGLCLTECPTYDVTGLEVESPRGRLVLLNEWAQHGGEPDPDSAAWLDDCLDCRACESVCPAHVPTGHLVEQWRATAPKDPHSDRLLRTLSTFVGSAQGLVWLRRMARLSHTPLTGLLPSVLGRELGSSVRKLADGLPPIGAGPISRRQLVSDVQSPRTLLFVGCIMDALYAESNVHTAALLRMAGHFVVIPADQRCCGALHVHGGRPQTARAWAQANIRAFEKSGAERVVLNAAGCGTTLKEYPQLFADDPRWRARAQRFSDAVKDILEVLDETPLPQLASTGETLTVHDACHHAHAQGIQQAPRRLLTRAGYQIEEMPNSTRCCGSAGVYNLTHDKMSQELVQKKVADIPAGVQWVSSANPGCMLQIQAGAKHHDRADVAVRHPVDLAYDAYRDAGYLTPSGGLVDEQFVE